MQSHSQLIEEEREMKHVNGTASDRKSKLQYTTSGKERTCYVLFFFGQCCVYILIASFLQLYMTDIGIPAITVGVIFLVAKGWDAINDPLFGVIVDKVNFKGGKYLPWLRIAAFLVPASTVFLFAIPNSIPLTYKIIWAFIGYIVWDTSYTVCDVPIFALVTSMTKNVKERAVLLGYGRIGVAIAAMIMMIGVPLIYPTLGWMPTAVIAGALSLIFMFPVTRAAKERFSEHDEKATVKRLIGETIKNRYLVIFLGANILGGMFNTASITSYFYIHAMGGPQTISLVTTILIVPTLLCTLLTPVIVKRFDKAIFMIGSYGFVILISIAIFLAGYQIFWVYALLLAVRTAATTFAGNMAIMLTADCAEYGLYKTGNHAEGITFAMQTFTVKFMSAISGALGMIMLGLVGFVEGAGAVQSDATIGWMWILITVVPAIGAFITFIILLLGYKLRDKEIQIMSQANQGLISREEADRLMNHKY
jgi:sugar (glycoside-pentoside-hexuronide) transporter